MAWFRVDRTFHDFIPAQPSIITKDSWIERNRLIAKYYPNIGDLLDLPEARVVEILIEVEQDERPASHFPVAFPGGTYAMAWLPSRSHLEWHLFRGVAPIARRPSISPRMRALVIERDGYRCGICQGHVEPTDIHLDHIHPFSRGGKTNPENLRVTHSRCNIRKGAKI